MKSVDTITAKIFLGLREGYSDKVHTLDELSDFLQLRTNRGGLCVTITPTTFIYKNGREEGAVIGLINYPRFPMDTEGLRKEAEEIARACKKEYKQNRVSIEYQDQTIMIE